MHDHLSSGHKHEYLGPPISLVHEAYGKILEHNKGISSFGEVVRTVVAVEEAEAKGTDGSTLEKALSDQSNENSIEADIQYLKYAETLGDAGVQLIDGGGSMAMVGSSNETMIGNGKLYPVVPGNSPEDVEKFVKYVGGLESGDDIRLLADVLKATRSAIAKGCTGQYREGVADADRNKLQSRVGEEIEKFIQIDEAAQINIPEALSKRYQKLEDEGYHKFCNTYGEFIEAKEAMGVYKDLKDAVTYYTQNVLPEFVFLGDADDERLLEPWPYVDAGIENVIMRITNEAVQVIQANHSPEALAYAQRYANNFEVGLIKTLDYLREFPDEDCQNCWLGDGETERTYSSIVQECLDKLRRAKDDAKINEQFNQIIDGLRW
ncbi:hypothetical protein QTN79_00900 [Candidatus Saccharibacteria bacterium oral taxon 488]